MQLCKSLLYYNEIHDIDYSRRRIMDLQPEDLRRQAEKLLATPFSTLTLR